VRVRLGQTGSTTAADCQLLLWQAERTTRRHSRDDPREDVGVGVRVGVGPVKFQLKRVGKPRLLSGMHDQTSVTSSSAPSDSCPSSALHG